MPAIVTMGEVLAEFMAAEIDQKLDVAGSFRGPNTGGAPAIFAGQAAMLGTPAALISAIGHDPFAESVMTSLRQRGVELRGIVKVGDLPTATAFVAYCSDGTRRFVFQIANAAPGSLKSSDVDPALFHGIRVFHVNGSSLFSSTMASAVRRGIEIAKAAGALISFDPNIRPEVVSRPQLVQFIHEIVSQADLMLPSEADVEYLNPGLSVKSAAETMLRQGASRVFVKRGALGNYYADDRHTIETPAFAADEVDPTGAGDCAAATFISGLIEGLPIETILRRANAAGAIAVSRLGGMAGCSSETEITDFLARYP